MNEWENESHEYVRLSRSLVLGTALLAFTSAHAHSPYLLPNLFDLGKRDHVSVQGSFTEVFFEPDVAMKSDDYHVVSRQGVSYTYSVVLEATE